MNKKNCITILIACFITFDNSFAQTATVVQQFKSALLEGISKDRYQDKSKYGALILEADNRISELNKSLITNSSEDDMRDRLAERVTALENRQNAVAQLELNLYSSNYKSAIVNLAFFEFDLKPLKLFQSTRDFYSSLGEIGNPLNYPEYQEWFSKFNEFVDEKKAKSKKLAVLSEILKLGKDKVSKTPLAGPSVGLIFDGIQSFLSGGAGRKLVEESEKMLQLTMILGQFNYEIGKIDAEWVQIKNSLEQLQKQDSALVQNNLNLLGESEENFKLKFSKSTDWEGKRNYINKLAALAKEKVLNEKTNNPKHWKDTFFYEMAKIQNLRVQFGDISLRIQANLERYNDLIDIFISNNLVSTKMTELKQKLQNLNSTFEETFDPKKYIEDAKVMYGIY